MGPNIHTGSDYVLLIDKPAGMTSHDVVAQIRRTLPRKTKVGHAGTLDPFATGLLLVLVGRGTRVQRFLMGLRKRYQATARFGAVSSTGDPEGEIQQTGVVPTGDLQLPTGRLMQRPPAYSAVKVGGKRAYQLARAGIEPELAAREVQVYSFVQRWHDGDRRGFEIECSAGTYVRTLIAELGDAYCEQLRRTAIGRFDVADADPERRLSLNQALDFLPELALDDEQARRAGHGQAVPGAPPGALAPGAPQRDLAPGATIRLTHDGELIALAQPGPAPGTVRAIVGLR